MNPQSEIEKLPVKFNIHDNTGFNIIEKIKREVRNATLQEVLDKIPRKIRYDDKHKSGIDCICMECNFITGQNKMISDFKQIIKDKIR